MIFGGTEAVYSKWIPFSRDVSSGNWMTLGVSDDGGWRV